MTRLAVNGTSLGASKLAGDHSRQKNDQPGTSTMINWGARLHHLTGKLKLVMCPATWDG
ncbi:hypothetical protein SAMN05661093_11254 [Kibdelosporangium aridum]|uniref:Uncharacterized protein n=1 Tax=Kibdelosporangium aridum TaxID=2030 RepID=A0A1Y5Y9S1_KIBAR|nr:hypothetical protein SAMN05661093_11254 [Kibdelosporangium aridum]